MMSKKLVAYFSASGVTAKAARLLAETVNADLFEIKPAVPYTRADLDWRNQTSRSTIEMKDRSARPEIQNHLDNMTDYNVVYLGFPIWWYREPSVIDTFLEQYDYAGKTIVLFATSGGSGFGKTLEGIKAIVSPQAKVVEGKVMNGSLDQKEIATWANV